jgi:biopolymer transport protein ExbB/TolQ
MVAWVALVVAWVALGFGVWSLFVASSVGWKRAFRRLNEENENAFALQRREMIRLRDEWTEFGEKLTKRYRAAARALAELEKRDDRDDEEPEPEHIPEDDAGTLPSRPMPTLHPSMVASGAFGAGRAG